MHNVIAINKFHNKNFTKRHYNSLNILYFLNTSENVISMSMKVMHFTLPQYLIFLIISV